MPNSKLGFTVLELVISLGIFLVIATAGAQIYNKLHTSSSIKAVEAELAQALRIARERSVAGLNGATHGVYVETNQYTHYQDSTPPYEYNLLTRSAADQAYDQVRTFGPNIIISRAGGDAVPSLAASIAQMLIETARAAVPYDVVFTRGTGTVVAPVTITITTSGSASPAKILTVNTQGAISSGSSGSYALRFYGHGVAAPDLDRVKIQIGDTTSPFTDPGPPADVGATDFTIEFWMRALASQNTAGAITCGANYNWVNGNIIVDRDRYNQSAAFGMSIAGGFPVFGVKGDASVTYTICGATSVLNDQWHHIAVTRTRVDGTMRLFIDGILEISADGPDGDISYPDTGVPGSSCPPPGGSGNPGSNPCTNSDPYIVIGAEKHDAGNNPTQFPSYSGYFDEMRISNNLRYTENFTPSSAPFATDANTMALYHFDEGANDTITDSSGAAGGPSNGTRKYGGSAPAGPEWTTTASPFSVVPGSLLASTGQWTAPITTPLVSIHMALLPNGNVLMWDSGDFNGPGTGAYVWNPVTDVHTTMSTPGFLAPNNNTFCAAQTSLPDGRVIVAGGHNGAAFVGITNTNILNFSPSESWVSGPVPPPMANARWYPTLTKLLDGRILVVSGTDTGSGSTVTAMQVYNPPPTNTWTTLTGAGVALPITVPAPLARSRPLYPFMFVIPDGRILYAGSDEEYTQTHVFTVTGTTGSWSLINSATLQGGSAVMYRPGRIIKAGAHGNTDVAAVPSVANAYTINTNVVEPWSWTATNPMNFSRAFHTLTPLPDGTVIVTGGTVNTGYQDPPTGGAAVLQAEIWTPNPGDLSTGTWATMALAQRRRAYHGNAILLPDGRVLVAGGGRLGGMTAQLDREIFSPPYLFKGPRPVISSAPATAGYNAPIAITMSDSTTKNQASSVALIALGAPTHGFDMNARYVPLTLNSQVGSTVNVTTPLNANIAPPGYYMLFIVNSNGVPSVANFIQVQ